MIILESDGYREDLKYSDFCIPIELFIPAYDDVEPVLTVFQGLLQFAESADCLTGKSGFEEFAFKIREGLISEIGFPDGPVVFDQYEFQFTDAAGKVDPELLEKVKISNEPVLSASIEINGEIVSVASLNDIESDDGKREIYVETEKEFRNSGFATACAAALSNRLLKDGITALYVCEADNLSSLRVAEKAGFQKLGRRFTAVFYKN